MNDISKTLSEFCSNEPTLEDPLALKHLLMTLVRKGHSTEDCYDVAIRLLEHLFSADDLPFDPAGILNPDRIYLDNILRMREHIRNRRFRENPNRISYLGRDADHIAADLPVWSIFKQINFALQLAIQPTMRAAVVTSIRNEGTSILEWIAHHRSIGFDEIFIYTNGNTDASTPLLQKLADNRIIRLIENDVDQDTPPQIKAFEHSTQFLPELRQFQWAFYIDADEFFIPRVEPNLHMDDFFKKLGATFGNSPPASIAFNWKWFGSENAFYKTDGLLLRRFLHSIHNAHVKSLVQIRSVLSMRLLHCPILFDGGRIVDSKFDSAPIRAIEISPVYDTGQINHYWNKSFQEFVVKKFRGRGAVGATGSQRDFSMFFEWGANGRRGNLDPPPERIVLRTQSAYNALLNLPGVADDMETINAAIKETISSIDRRIDLKKIYEKRGKS